MRFVKKTTNADKIYFQIQNNYARAAREGVIMAKTTKSCQVPIQNNSNTSLVTETSGSEAEERVYSRHQSQRERENRRI